MGFFANLLSGGRVDVASRFEILREAISGTMSEFYKARDRKTGQVVGVKVLDRAKTEFFESRFKGLKKPTEGEIAQALSHPYIVKTLEHGLTTKGQQYLVMEFLEGPGMNSLIVAKEGQLVGQRLPLVRQAAEAVRALHQAGYIHRDVCPRNFVVAPDLKSLKLIDFGLTVPATEMFMQPGNRTGTANYMAPELVKRQRTDQRLDVFALGVTLYELLTWELPWARGTDGRVAMTHAATPPTDIREYRPKLHPTLAKAIHSCLEREPAKRCASIDTFLQSIKTVDREEA